MYDNWNGPNADALQEKISGVRKVVQSLPMIPFIKAIIAHYRGDPAWARLRPPLVEVEKAQAAAAIATLEREHGFRMDINGS